MSLRIEEPRNLIFVADNGGPDVKGGTLDRYSIQLDNALISTNSNAVIWDYSPDIIMSLEDADNLGKEIKWEDLDDFLKSLINFYNDEYYFYNGFQEPTRIDIDDLRLINNYLGDVTAEFTEEHTTMWSGPDLEYNERVGFYGVFRNPTYDELKELNLRVGLNETEYIESFM